MTENINNRDHTNTIILVFFSKCQIRREFSLSIPVAVAAAACIAAPGAAQAHAVCGARIFGIVIGELQQIDAGRHGGAGRVHPDILVPSPENPFFKTEANSAEAKALAYAQTRHSILRAVSLR
jgi:ABC-type sugar transport system substrate-binding protein